MYTWEKLFVLVSVVSLALFVRALAREVYLAYLRRQLKYARALYHSDIISIEELCQYYANIEAKVKPEQKEKLSGSLGN